MLITRLLLSEHLCNYPNGLSHVIFCLQGTAASIPNRQPSSRSVSPARIGAARANPRSQPNPTSHDHAGNTSAPSDTVYRVIAYRRRHNGRSNQGAQRQNPGQPGRGLLLLNPLVSTRKRRGGKTGPRGICIARMDRKSQDVGKAEMQWLGYEQILREHWLTMFPTAQTSGARPPTSVSPLRPLWTLRRTPRCTSSIIARASCDVQVSTCHG